MGDLSNAEQDYAQASEYYAKALEALEICKKTVETKPDDKQTLSERSGFDFGFGLSNDQDKGLEYYEKALTILKKLVECKPDDRQARRALNTTYDRLGVANLDANHERAREYFAKTLEIRKKTVDDNPDDRQALSDLCVSYDNFGLLTWSETEFCSPDDYKQARELFEKGLEIRKKIVEQTPDDLQALTALSVSYENLGWAASMQCLDEQGIEHYNTALKIRASVLEQAPDNPQAFNDLYDVYEDLMDLLEASDELPQALECSVVERSRADKPQSCCCATARFITTTDFGIGGRARSARILRKDRNCKKIVV